MTESIFPRALLIAVAEEQFEKLVATYINEGKMSDDEARAKALENSPTKLPEDRRPDEERAVESRRVTQLLEMARRLNYAHLMRQHHASSNGPVKRALESCVTLLLVDLKELAVVTVGPDSWRVVHVHGLGPTARLLDEYLSIDFIQDRVQERLRELMVKRYRSAARNAVSQDFKFRNEDERQAEVERRVHQWLLELDASPDPTVHLGLLPAEDSYSLRWHLASPIGQDDGSYQKMLGDIAKSGSDLAR